MNILIVSQHYYPDSFRINEISEELVKRGHDVTVLTSLPDYATGKVPKECRGLKNRKLTINGVSVIRSFSFSRRRGVLFRALNYASFCISSTLKARCLKKKFDIVFCYQTSPVLMANAARAVAKKQGIPFFLYCLDIWPECIKAWHVGEGNPLFKLMHRYSKKLYNSVDVLAVSSNPFIEYMYAVNCVDKSKTVYLPQHSEDMNLPPKKREENIKLAFGGNIGSVQNIECIVKAVALLKDLNGFSVEIYGDGSELGNCKKLAHDLGVEDKLNFHGRVDRATLWNEYRNVDAFLLTLKSEGCIGLTAPAKLQEYMSGNRPVIAAIGGAAAEIITSSGCGVALFDDDHIALADAIKAFVTDRNFLQGAAEKGRRYFEENFTLECYMKSLETIFEQMTNGRLAN